MKPCRAQNSQSSKNLDLRFAARTMKHEEDLVILTCAANVAIVGKDDKSHMLLRIPATNKQSPIMMTIEYLATVSDHTIGVATS